MHLKEHAPVQAEASAGAPDPVPTPIPTGESVQQKHLFSTIFGDFWAAIDLPSAQSTSLFAPVQTGAHVKKGQELDYPVLLSTTGAWEVLLFKLNTSTGAPALLSITGTCCNLSICQVTNSQYSSMETQQCAENHLTPH